MAISLEEFNSIKVGDSIKTIDCSSLDIYHARNLILEVCGVEGRGGRHVATGGTPAVAAIHPKGFKCELYTDNYGIDLTLYGGQLFYGFPITKIASLIRKAKHKAIDDQPALIDGSLYSKGPEGETLGPSGYKFL